MKIFLQKRLTLLVFLLGVVGNLLAQGNTNMVLVAETDFSCSGKGSTSNFASIDKVDGFGNSLIKPRLLTSLSLATTTRSTEKKSDFLSKAQYAITSNPKKLDELRMIDEEGWGFVTSTTKSEQVLLNMIVNGLKDKSDYKVEIKYSVPLTDNEIQSSHYNVTLRAIANPDYNNTTNGELSQNLDSHMIKSGHTSTLVVTPNSTGSNPISGGTLNLHISAAKGVLGQAIMIKSIKVYGVVDAKIQGEESVCTGDETVTLSVAKKYRNYPDSAYTWYKDGTVISERGSQITHISGNTPGKHTYYYEMNVPDEEGNIVAIKSESHTVEGQMCCENNIGDQTPLKLIWQEDFGTFTSATEYWMWDYSDIDNPIKVSYNNANKWTTCVELTQYAHAKCDTIPSTEGKYCVAANVTCAHDSVQDGTRWGLEAYFGNGQSPKKNGWTFIPDHTYGTSAYGGMLFLNCNNERDHVIYTRQIHGLYETNYTALCHVNTFSNGENPVDIYIQVKDLTTGDIYKSVRVKKSSTEGKNWAVARLDFELWEGGSIELSVISYGGGSESYNKNGNDLVLDDIQIYMCAPTEEVGVETQPAAEMDEMVNVYTISGIIVKTNVKRSEALNGLKKGSYYIVGHEKVLIDL